MYKLHVYYKDVGRSFYRAVPLNVFTDEKAIEYAEKFSTDVDPQAQVLAVVKGSLYNGESVLKSFPVAE